MARRIDHAGAKDDTYVISDGLSLADSNSKVEDGEGEADNDAPAIFLCGKCRLPFGDSLSWAGSDDEQNLILLKRTINIRFYITHNADINITHMPYD